MTAGGNFEGHNILNRLGAIELRDAETEARLAAMRAKLLERRASRVRPGFDDKVLADWNGLMIAALANAARRVRPRRLARGGRARFQFRLYTDDFGRATAACLSRRRGEGAGDRIRLRQHDQGGARSRQRHRQAATISSARKRGPTCSTSIIGRTNLGGYYFAADDTSDLIVRPFSGQDEATPNANGAMVSNLVALYLWTGEERYRERAEAMLRAFAGAMAANVLAHAGLLGAALDVMAPAHVVLIVPEGDEHARAAPRAGRCVAAECRGAGGEGRGVGRGRPAGVIAGAWQDRDRRQADGLCLHRPAMLPAGDGCCGAGGDGEGRASGFGDVGFLQRGTVVMPGVVPGIY